MSDRDSPQTQGLTPSPTSLAIRCQQLPCAWTWGSEQDLMQFLPSRVYSLIEARKSYRKDCNPHHESLVLLPCLQPTSQTDLNSFSLESERGHVALQETTANWLAWHLFSIFAPEKINLRQFIHTASAFGL